MKRCLIFILVALLLAGCGSSGKVVAEEPKAAAPQVQTESVPEAVQPELEDVQAPVFALTQTEVVFSGHGQQMQICDETSAEMGAVWTSADEAVATVENGVVTAVERGETTVTAQLGEQTLSCRVICDLPILPVKDENAGPEDPVHLPPEVEIVDGSFFDDALFISDSQGWAFYACSDAENLLGESVHLTRRSYSVDSAANNRMLLSWCGVDYVIEDAIERTGAKRVFFMLGINDVGMYELEDFHLIMENWQKMLDKIREKNPDVQLCIQSIAPVWTQGETEDFNNEKVRAYNEQLQALAEENGCVFIDLVPYLVDATGGMAEVYCLDNFVHLNPEGIYTWIKVLKACTDYE